jgi:hypothetical protein
MPPKFENNLSLVKNQPELKPPHKHTRLILLIIGLILVVILLIGYFTWQSKFHSSCDQCDIPNPILTTLMYPNASVSISTSAFIAMTTFDGRLKVQNYYESEIPLMGWTKIADLDPEDITDCGRDWGGTYQKNQLKFKLHVCGFENSGTLTNIIFNYLGNYKLFGILFPNFSATTTTQIIGGNKDEHGCLGSAGYSWCAVKNKCLRVWEESCGSGIRGKVTIGPTCPVQIVPPDLNCADKPFPAGFYVKNKDGQVVKSFTSDANGAFSVELPSGEFVITNIPSPGTYPRFTEQNVTISPNKYLEVNLQFDSGIR